MAVSVFIDGGEGTTGLRLRDRLESRSDIHLLTIDAALRKDQEERARVSNEADIVFLCLPDDAARAAVGRITNPETRIIDTSTAHRVAPGWTYGFPELSSGQRKAIQSSRRVAVPGCHAFGFNSLVAPLVRGGIIDPDFPVTCHSVTGYSGGGKGMIAQYADPDRPAYYGNPRQYALGQRHKHLPEMQAVAGLRYPPVFNPIIADFYAGMVVTMPLHTRLLNKYKSAGELGAYFADYYAGQQLVRVPAPESFQEAMLDAGALAGMDHAEIFVFGHQDQAILAARFDNLGKGASGGAIQCMNLVCGLEETAGLHLPTGGENG